MVASFSIQGSFAGEVLRRRADEISGTLSRNGNANVMTFTALGQTIFASCLKKGVTRKKVWDVSAAQQSNDKDKDTLSFTVDDTGDLEKTVQEIATLLAEVEAERKMAQAIQGAFPGANFSENTVELN